MKKTMKRLICVMLSLTILFGCYPVNAFAATEVNSGKCSLVAATDKKDYISGEEIVITVTADNNSDNNYNISVDFFSTAYINLDEKLLNGVSFENFRAGRSSERTYSAVAERKQQNNAFVQAFSDFFSGTFVTGFYKFLGAIIPGYNCVSVKVDGVASAIVYKVKTSKVKDGAMTDEGDYAVTFNYNYENSPESIVNMTTEANYVVYPESPEREDFLFIGWYTTAECAEIFDYTQLITSDIELYAGWLDISDKTDTDNEGLIDCIEDYIGTDKTKADTDGDKLTDYEEYSVIGTDPFVADEDGNGTKDGDDDFDADRLTNRQELDRSTDIYASDSDADGLSDYDEIFVRSTDPIKADTDDDGLNDGDELKYKMNPKDSDTLNDGIKDGDRSFTVTATSEDSDEDIVPELEIELQGNQIASLSIKEVSANDPILTEDIPGYIGKAYDFNVEGTFETAELSFEIPAELFEDENFVPAIYYYNESTQCLEELENQTLDGNTISAPITHFSKYIVLAKDKYEKNLFEFEIEGEDVSVHLAILLDRSTLISYVPQLVFRDDWYVTSAEYSAGENYLHNSVLSLINGLDENDKVSIFYNSGAATNMLFPQAYVDKEYALSNFSSAFYGSQSMSGWRSDLSYLFKCGTDCIIQNKKENQIDIIVCFSPNCDTSSARYTNVCVNAINENDISVHTVTIGNAAYNIIVPYEKNENGEEIPPAIKEILDTPKVRNLTTYSSGAGGSHYDASDYSGIQAATDYISQAILYKKIKDTDGDGLSDSHEKAIANGQLKLGTGIEMENFESLDYKNSDSDGDGLPDGEELEIKSVEIGEELVFYCHMTSNPCMIDSDYDGYLDEVTGKTTSKEKNAEKDERPLQWDVSARDLAMFSSIIYSDDIYSLIGRDLSKVKGAAADKLNNSFQETASLEELKGWKLTAVFDNATIPGAPIGLEGIRFGIFEKDDNAVVAYRGSSTVDDWANNILMYPQAIDIGVPVVQDSVENIIAMVSPNKKLYITGHSRGGMLAQHAAAELVLWGYGNRIAELAYFNGIGAIFNGWAEDEQTVIIKKSLETISNRISRYWVYGDIVDRIGWHAVPVKKTVFRIGLILNQTPIYNQLKCHEMTNFTFHFMTDRYERVKK